MKTKVFKVGDKVRLVKHGKIEEEVREWTKLDGLKLRHIYKVTSEMFGIAVHGAIHRFFYHPNHFAKVRGKK